MKYRLIAFALVAVAAIGAFVAPLALAQRDEPAEHSTGPASAPDVRDRDSKVQYGEGYRAGYRVGFTAARTRNQYDDRPIARDDGRDGPSERWLRRYAKEYTLADDLYYQHCRGAPDPAGIVAQAMIGGLLDTKDDHGGASVAGVILAGVLGSTMTTGLGCDDQSYAYKAYYDGFNSGRTNSAFDWRNPRNGHSGDLLIARYINDPDGFRCADYNMRMSVKDKQQAATGRACQQPDGTWVIVG
jgi:surface antigen